tara:strand:+ start:9330 stop:9719 length:390 start_codon:yes stop_codon:yes gene_type:complete
MELSLFLAQLFGLSLMIAAVSGLIRPKFIEGVIDDVRGNKALELLFGYVGVIAGLAIVLTHNNWVSDWRVIITIFGWGALIKGVMYLAAPKMIIDMGGSIYITPNRTKLVLVLAFALGAYLAAKGFGMV